MSNKWPYQSTIAVLHRLAVLVLTLVILASGCDAHLPIKEPALDSRPLNPVMSTLLQLQQIHAASVLSRKASLSKKEREKRDYYIESNNIVEDKLGVSWSSRGIPRLVTGFEMRIPATVGMRGASPLEASYAFLSQYADLWKMSDPKRELSLIRKSVDRAGNTHLSFSQQYEGLPIFHSSFMVHLNPDLEVIGVNGLYVPVSDILLMPLVSKHRAEEIVRNSKLASTTKRGQSP